MAHTGHPGPTYTMQYNTQIQKHIHKYKYTNINAQIQTHTHTHTHTHTEGIKAQCQSTNPLQEAKFFLVWVLTRPWSFLLIPRFNWN